MNRPVYESEQDLFRERQLAVKAGRSWRCKMVKQNKFNQFDYAATRDGCVVAFIELRVRSTPFLKYPTMIISVSKLQAAQSMHMATGLPCIFLVQWSDCAGFTDMLKQHPVRIGGRTDRNDLADVEALAEIPMEDFTIL